LGEEMVRLQEDLMCAAVTFSPEVVLDEKLQKTAVEFETQDD